MNQHTITVPVQIAELNGAIIRVEATELEPTILENDAEVEGEVSARFLSFQEVTSTISGISTLLASALKSAQPTKASVEFGIELEHKSDTLLAKIVQGSGKVNLKIHLEWSSH